MERARTAGSGLRLALGLTLAVLVVELAGGLLSHSLALLADAGHVLTDVFALGLVTLRGGSQNLNLRAALLHVTGDVASSAGVVVAGAVILLTGWLYIDPLLSLGIAVFIAYSAWGIIRETVNLLMEGTPPEI